MPELEIPVQVTGSEAPTPPAKEPATEQRPAWLPEKFASPEKMAEAYAELERKQSAPPEAKPVAPPAAPASPDASVEGSLVSAGFDLQALGKEYVENGNALTPETMAALAAKGITADVVSTYAAAAKAQADAIVASITEAAGGADRFQAIYQWAGANLSKDDLDAYNSIMDAGKPAVSKLAFEGLLARYTAATGSDPKMITGEARSVTGVKPYASRAEITKDMARKDYREDPAYRAKVSQRLEATEFANLL